MLMEHGTVTVRLSPNNIVQAALADLKLRNKKLVRRADEGALYSFARKHVHRAGNVGHLIALALFEPHAAAKTDKHSTLVVYGDVELLRVTLIGILDGSIEMPEVPDYAPVEQAQV